jgi:hypothetical protein
MNTIKWVGTAASILGAFAVAGKMYLLGYTVLVIGSLSWAFVGLRLRESSLVVLNGAFLCANILGLYNALT